MGRLAVRHHVVRLQQTELVESKVAADNRTKLGGTKENKMNETETLGEPKQTPEAMPSPNWQGSRVDV